MNISIIGAGVSGLSSAYYLDKLARQAGTDIQISIFEKNNKPGGSISTVREDGFVYEQGADSFITSKPWALDLCREIGLEDKLIAPNDNNRRTFVYFNNKLNVLPEGFFLMAPSNLEAFSSSSFFSGNEKERILSEQSVPKKEDDAEESVDEFVNRRFGNDLLEKVAKPLIGGIYTGDTKKLSMNAVLPEFVSLEKEFGSVIKGIQTKYASSRISEAESGARYGLFLSLENGMTTLIDGLIGAMPEVEINYNSELVSITFEDGKWILRDRAGEKYVSDALILAVPSFIASDLLGDIDTGLSDNLRKIENASSIVVVYEVLKENLKNLPECFGIVVPPSERMDVLACSFSSRKFAGRAREGYELIRCFAGGVLNPDILNMSEDAITELLIKELNLILNADIEPNVLSVKKYYNAMPQYNLGYPDIIKNINERIASLKTVSIAGNAYSGVGIPDCIKSGKNAAEYIIKNLVSNLN